jgi:hypothetical protein
MKITKKDLLNELILKQKKNISDDFLLSYRDLNRVVKNIETSLFSDECCFWKGYVIQRQNKYYINFFFKGIKVNLIRLLYQNFVDKIENNEYIKNICASGGKCCNITHYKKYIDDYNNDNNDNNDNIDNNDNNDDINDDNNENSNDDNNDDKIDDKIDKNYYIKNNKNHLNNLDNLNNLNNLNNSDLDDFKVIF